MLHDVSNRSIYKGADNGIFDAMNRACKYCKGKYILFLNARDTFEETFELENLERHGGPCLIRVIYEDFFGRHKCVVLRNNLKLEFLTVTKVCCWSAIKLCSRQI